MGVSTQEDAAAQKLPASAPVDNERRTSPIPQGHSVSAESLRSPAVDLQNPQGRELRIDRPAVEFGRTRRTQSIGTAIVSGIVSLGTRLEPAEWRRRMWHFAPGFLPFILWGIPHSDPLSLRVRGIFAVLILGLAITIYRRYDRIRRHGEQSGEFGPVVGYAGSILLTFLLLPAHAEIGMAVVAILAFGDGSATMFGKLLRGPALPWNRDKTWAGLGAFLLIGTLMASIIYWGESHNLKAQLPGVSAWTAVICGGVPVLIAAFAESVSSRINDNIRVGVTAAVTATAIHAMMVGL